MASIRKRGDKWQVQVRRKGHAPISRSFLKKADAQEWGRQREAEADRRDLVPDRRALETITLRQLVERYRNEVTPRKKAAANETILLNAFLRAAICKKPLSSVTPTDFARYRDDRLRKIAARSLKREFSPLHNMFEIAREEWGLPLRDNPIDKVRLDSKDNRRERRLKDGERDRLIQAAKTRKNSLILPIILFALETAMRRGEILATRWRDVDLKRSSVLIPEAKNGHSRRIPLAPLAVSLLEDLRLSTRDETDKVFPVTPVALRLSWDRLTKKAGIEDLNFHDLRHEAISRFFEIGLTAPEVASISGHRDARMLFRYAHANTTLVQQKLQAVPPSSSTPGSSH